MLRRAAAIWVVILVVAIANGVLREFLIAPRWGAFAAHIVSTLILCAAIFIVALVSIRWMGPRSRGGAILIGVIWFALTLAFEFLAGHFLFGNSWENLLADYDLLRGRVWIAVLVVTLFSPTWAFAWRKPSA